MAGYNLISTQDAVALVEAAGLNDPVLKLTHYGRAGLVDGHAKWMEVVQPSGVRSEVRHKRIPAHVWRRILDEKKWHEILDDTVSLDGSSNFGGGAKLTLTGFRFDERSVKSAIAHRDATPVKTQAAPPTCSTGAGNTSSRTIDNDDPLPATQPKRQRKAPDPTAIPEGALLCTVKQAGAALGCGRTTINKYMSDGRVERVEGVAGTRITVVSVRKLAGELTAAES